MVPILLPMTPTVILGRMGRKCITWTMMDGMASGWEYYFGFDPFDDYDRDDDPDLDSYENWCEYKWNTNPKDIQSQPGAFQLCTTDD